VGFSPLPTGAPRSPAQSTKVRPLFQPGNHGFTALEVLIALSGVIILIAFTGPFWVRSAAKSEMKTAVTSVQTSILAARRAAQIYQTEVVLHLPARADGPQVLSYSVPSTRKFDVLPEFQKNGFARRGSASWPTRTRFSSTPGGKLSARHK
jgi:type II secretory pathway pseudopilin PulG